MLNVAVMGCGTVGSGVVEILLGHVESIARKAGDEIRVKYILDLRELPAQWEDRHITDFSVIEQDPEVDIVVETMGGVGAALEFTRRALLAGKSVVTSNKEVVAAHGCELNRIAKEKGVCYLFEASVGGGIPIIRPLSQCLAANEILELRGILNGTTNYILTRMIRAGLSFEEALAEAQEKGYAERDPSADILGHDACRKICILSDIAFGRHISPEQVPAEGITGVTLADVDYAGAAGKKIKLLGRAVRQADGRICACVAPHLVDQADPLAGVEDVFNAIAVRGDSIGEVMFYGRGAGKLPTASAVVADVIDIASHQGHRKAMSWDEGGDDVVCSGDVLKSRWYVRGEGDLSAALGCVQSLTRADAAPAESACITEEEMTRSEAEKKLTGVKVLSLIRVLD
ncbi:MAG: homoserine dehydrogenase [Oscillospiraceae bacterium]|nr:homoserine dehydrogenase [Oscillospiraceae bacterium]